MSHIHEKIDFTIEALIINQNKVLLRHHEKYNIWLTIGGHIELDEDPVQALIREVKEEVGLDVVLVKPPQFTVFHGEQYEELVPPFFLNRHRINENHEHVTMTYIATSESNNINIGEGEANVPCKWFSKEELDDPKHQIRPSLVSNAKYALDLVLRYQS